MKLMYISVCFAFLSKVKDCALGIMLNVLDMNERYFLEYAQWQHQIKCFLGGKGAGEDFRGEVNKCMQACKKKIDIFAFFVLKSNLG